MTARGQTLRLTATVTDQNGNTLSGISVTWKSSNTEVATVDGNGLITAVRTGSATITATVESVTGAVQVQVALPFASIVITPSEPEVLTTAGQTLRLDAVAKDQDGVVYRGLQLNWGVTVSWTSSDTSVVTVSAKGTVTAVNNGTAVITATAVDTGNARFTFTPGTVQVQVATHPVPATIAIAPAEPDTLRVIGQTLQLTTTVADQNGNEMSEYTISWTSSDEMVATVNTAGTVTAVGIGSATITATSGAVTGTVQVHVATHPVPAAIVIEPAEPDTLRVIGQTLQLTATAMDQNGNTLSEISISWTSSNTAVATVDDNGLVTAFDTGTAVIRALIPGRLYEYDDVIADVTVEIQAPPNLDREALVALYNGTDGPSWTNNANWLTDASVGSWFGVSSSVTGRVISVNLSGNRLKGLIPPEIGLLSVIGYLVLSGNQLAGALPPEIGMLSALKKLYLSESQLTGAIPPEIGRLESLEELILYENELTRVPPEIGRLKNLRNLNLGRNRLTSIPAEIGQLENLHTLELYTNDLTSNSIPPEIGRLKNLRTLGLGWNPLTSIPEAILEMSTLEELGLSSSQLSGEIPPEIGQMSALRKLILQTNQLTGAIPPEIGQLQNLELLWLNVNELTGPIPPEIGQLKSLQELFLHRNKLTGPISPEIGLLIGLKKLSIHTNQLTGPIPPEIGQLKNLQSLRLSDNQLTGPIPPEIAGAESLQYLYLQNNRLTGRVPPEIGQLQNLLYLNLGGNPGLFGPLPGEIATLTDLNHLTVDGTQLCAPQDPEFDDFLKRLVTSRVPRCETSTGSVAYLTQATQSTTYPVPLVAGEDALLRVFVLADDEVEADMPPVRATFYNNGAKVHSVDTRAQVSRIPSLLDEGSLASSANAVVPGSIIAPGLELVVDIDPDGTLGPLQGVQSVIPEAGRLAIEVLDVPPLNLTIIPLVWSEEPDLTVVTETELLNPEDDLFRLTRDLLPVRDFHLRRLEPVYTSVDPVFDTETGLFEIVMAIQKTDGRGGHYMGILSGLGGKAAQTTALTLSGLDAATIAHELGHNMLLQHAPCGVSSWDRFYPYPEGNVGTWGYDFLTGELVSPDTADLMSYCGPPDWISDYNFSKAIRFRQTDEYKKRIAAASSDVATRTLLLWGGVDQSGDIALNPAFVVDAATSPPVESGPYRITGEDADGRALFSFDFEMDEIADGEGGVFAYTIPVDPSWRRLDRISLSGPEGLATLDATGDAAMALLRDRFTGQVRGFLRDIHVSSSGAVSARRSLPEPGLEMIISRGVPDQSDW